MDFEEESDMIVHFLKKKTLVAIRRQECLQEDKFRRHLQYTKQEIAAQTRMPLAQVVGFRAYF